MRFLPLKLVLAELARKMNKEKAYAGQRQLTLLTVFLSWEVNIPKEENRQIFLAKLIKKYVITLFKDIKSGDQNAYQ